MNRDLLKNTLENAGFTSMESETLSHIIGDLATKEDLRILSAELRAEINGKTDSLRSDLLAVIERTARETQMQMMRMMVGLIISLATIFTLLDIFID